MTAYPLSPGIEGFPRVDPAIPYGEGPGAFVMGLDLDWGKIATARANAGLPALVAGDTVIVGSLAAGNYIVASGVNVTVASPAAAAVSLTVGAGVTLTMAAGTLGWVDGGAGGHGLTAATNIILVLTAVPASGKARFTLLLADLA